MERKSEDDRDRDEHTAGTAAVRKRAVALTPIGSKVALPTASTRGQKVKERPKPEHADTVEDLAPVIARKSFATNTKALPDPRLPSDTFEGKRLSILKTKVPTRIDDTRRAQTNSPGVKQWEFKMAPKFSGDLVCADEAEEEGRSWRPPQGPPPSLKFHRQSVPLPQPVTGLTPKPQALAKAPPRKHGVSATVANAVPDFTISGHQRTGVIDETTAAATTHTLVALEGAVARAKRLRAELLQAQRQVLLGFRTLVRQYMATLAFPPLRPAHHRLNQPSVQMLKCSVVVHTLATTIQSYMRYRQTVGVIARIGLDENRGQRMLAQSVDRPQPLDTEALSESTYAGPDSIDSTTFAQMKQLYFAYYDCESYTLDSSMAHDATTKRLGSGRSLDVRNVIAEENVLVPDEDGARDIPERSDAPSQSPHESMLFDERRERRQIYSDAESD